MKVPKIKTMDDAIRAAKLILNENPNQTMVIASRILIFLAEQEETE